MKDNNMINGEVTFLANSGGQALEKHLKGTMIVAMYCAENILGIEDKSLVNVIGLSAFFHDIGKCTKWFQNFTLKNDKPSVSDYYPKYSGNKGDKLNYPRHNEISFIYANCHAKAKNNLFKEVGIQAIYWHHPTYFNSEIEERDTPTIIGEMRVFDQEEDKLVFGSIEKIISSTNFPFNIEEYIEKECDQNNSEKIPKLFKEHDEGAFNAQRLLVRSCVTYADHTVSALSVSELDELLTYKYTDNNIQKFLNIKTDLKNFKIDCPNSYNIERFDVQRSIVRDCDRTTLVKAPAGFGKSLIGILWGLEQKGQVYWVCPRNAVAEGVYNNICEELKEFKIDISVELFLTSERVSATDTSVEVCKSDIVVTNIDNLLSPMVNSCKGIFDINASNVVFDEFHEFSSEEAMFSGFIIYMQARHLLSTKCKTLLLSATPSIMYKFWESEDNKTTILPNNDEHYKAQHTEKYDISFTNELIPNPLSKSLTMYSSIKNVQLNYKNKNYNSIIHSRYSKEDRQKKMDNILDLFGKNGTAKDECVISGPVLQAALNISFDSLNKTIESPESDVQVIGRANRWGEKKETTKINFIDIFNKISEKSEDEKSLIRSEKAAINSRYNSDLAHSWKVFVENQLTTGITLNELYIIYNKFNLANEKELLSFLKEKNKDSLKKLISFHPVQRFKKDEDKMFSGKTLRSYKPGTFIVVKDKNDRWCNFTFNISSIELKDIIAKDENEKNLKSSTLNTVFDKLNKIECNNKLVFDYSDLQKKSRNKKKSRKLTMEDIVKAARCSSTPLPVWTYIYDTTLGLVEK